MNAKILSVIASQKLGFFFSKPKRVDEKSLTVIVPILRQTSLKRQYITFPETDKVLVFDTGKIDEMEAENTSEENVFIRSGTLFKGSTQERALQRSAVIFPGKKMKLSVRCVHASRGINPNVKTTYGGTTPLSFDQANYSHGYKPADQSTYWSNVHNATAKFASLSGMYVKPSHLHQKSFHPRRRAGYSSPMGAMSHSYFIGNIGSPEVEQDYASFDGTPLREGPTLAKHDDLASNLDAFALKFDEILSKVKLEENQAGTALITDSGVQTIEFFDHCDSWAAFHKSAVKRMGAELVKEDKENVFEFKPEIAIKKILEVLGLDWKTNQIFEHRPSNGEPRVEIFGISAGDYVGEIVEIHDDCLHGVILKKAA